MSDTPTGRICWYELLTNDPEGAAAFYTQVLGWGTDTHSGGGTPYTMWVNGEQPIGGVMELPPEAVAQGTPPNWLMYVSTPDIEGTTQRARELRAQILAGPMDLPDVGVISVIADPQGPVFAAYQPATFTPGHDGPAAVGEFSWHEIISTDWEAGWSFYAELFAWQQDDAMDMGEMGTYQMFNRGAHALGGFMNKPPHMPVPCWMLYARVADLDAVAAAVREHGGQVVNEPMEVPGGDRVAHFMDPQGAMFAAHEVVSGSMTA
jgi:predicted enzyme related to lactoylglutathione lyase